MKPVIVVAFLALLLAAIVGVAHHVPGCLPLLGALTLGAVLAPARASDHQPPKESP